MSLDTAPGGGPAQGGGAPTGVGVRATKQRAAISQLLAETPEFRSAQDLHTRLREQGDSTGLTTVYRTLQAMSDAGLIDVLRTGSGECLYRQCGSADHHHHLVCRRCGRAIEIQAPEVEAWAEEIGARFGYRQVSHAVEIFGTCDRCPDLMPDRDKTTEPAP